MTTQQVVKELVLIEQPLRTLNKLATPVALFDTEGNPLVITETVGSILLTGYAIAVARADIQATDTLLEALGKIQKSIDTIGSELLTGYVVAVAAADVADTDTILEAFGKLQKQINDLDTTVADHESRLDVLEA